jgi:hypothetical protein
VAGVAAGLQVGPKIVEAERTGAFLQVPIAAAIGRKAARKDQPTRRLCCLWVCPCVAGPAGDHDVEPGDHRRLEEPDALAAHRAQADQLGERVGAEHEPPDVDRPVAPGDVGDDDVEPGTVAQGGVDEWAGEVDPAATGPEHELDQVVDVLLAEHGGGQLRPSGLGHYQGSAIHATREVHRGQAGIYVRISRVRNQDEGGRLETLGVERQEPPCREPRTGG